MGLFGSREEKLENKAQQYRNAGLFQYNDNIKASLAPKDGKLHVLMVNSFSKWLNQTFECENNRYTYRSTASSPPCRMTATRSWTSSSTPSRDRASRATWRASTP